MKGLVRAQADFNILLHGGVLFIRSGFYPLRADVYLQEVKSSQGHVICGEGWTLGPMTQKTPERARKATGSLINKQDADAARPP